ncbi:universal stress protein [Hymenobacter latericus]|uniref:universal stress protein n=1 Tax=Hymenobacter sp. YIM 151858-1 TaxID=2987688 RepID=UPI0022278113|nr:universal stress protein [Hymenobacter sp. YIM 151858-1]UYZ60368.1 universal stress protein [Hymenobacter sp. YIM 151858-1]
MDTIVVLTDLSPAAEQARRYAAQVAAPLGARVVLLHLSQELTLPSNATETSAEIRRTLPAKLQALADEMLVPTTAEVVEGNFDEDIDAIIERYNPMLLVLGLTQANSYFEALLSNRALNMLRYGACPVVLVPASAALTPPYRVVLAVDGEAFTVPQAAAAVLDEVFTTWAVSPTVVNTVGSAAKASIAALQQVQASGLLRGEQQLNYQQPVVKAPEEGILRVVAEQRANLLVMIARRRSLLGQLFHRSVTSRVLRSTNVPVLLLPGDEVPVAAEPKTADTYFVPLV